MDTKAAQKLKVGDAVLFRPGSLPGKVTEANPISVKIKWGNGQYSILIRSHELREIDRSIRIGA